MPFVGTKRAKDLYDSKIEPETVGDLCAIAYTPIIRAWREEPRWTTVHTKIFPMLSSIQKLLERRIGNDWKKFTKSDATVATKLAYDVFFGLYVLDYEKKKREENGDIE